MKIATPPIRFFYETYLSEVVTAAINISRSIVQYNYQDERYALQIARFTYCAES